MRTRIVEFKTNTLGPNSMPYDHGNLSKQSVSREKSRALKMWFYRLKLKSIIEFLRTFCAQHSHLPPELLRVGIYCLIPPNLAIGPGPYNLETHNKLKLFCQILFNLIEQKSQIIIEDLTWSWFEPLIKYRFF